MKRMLSGLLLAGAMLGTLSASAGGGHGNGKHSARMQARMLESLKAEANADDATVEKVKSILTARSKEKEEVHLRLKTSMASLKTLVDGGSKDDAAYEKALAEVRAARDQMHALHEQERQELERVLTPQQRARMLVSMEGKFRHRMHGRMDKTGEVSGQ